MKHQLNIVVASTRPGRVGPVFARWLEAYAREHGKFEPVITDIEAFGLPIFDEPRHPRLGQYENEHTKKWSEAIKAGDAYVFVTPEYNFFAAPALVNAVNYLAREWNYKPAGFLSYGGVSAGLRAVQAEKMLLTTLKIMPIPEAIAIPAFAQHLDEDGEFKANELVKDSANSMLDELHRWSEALKPLRAG
ncbi:NADPH-dependent FMN reductase [Aminobacter aganoensis]|uniref:NAD(P)H-dependent FMN reductase n=1 Tax=Aminobacter aganoensis TaxID=83264 RepID=A0A7X0F6C1_9HYPH|nr:NADPH-dependent FMN reductase [Aminobacter aganoensis]MBB6353962.1 NAD(P)H-dependent FMN reductase [Aminobacter aganoensis]